MRIVFLPGVLLTLAVLLPAPSYAQDTDIESLRIAIDELRADYDARIAELERRLAVAEQNASQAGYAAVQPTAQPGSSAGNAAFNPAIGVVFQGFLNGNSGAAGEDEGFALGETELIMSANVDDKFTAYLTAALALENGESELEIEEAWVETTALPAGFGARFGRMFSGLGYQNSRHSHTWDFTDQPLVYEVFLDGRYVDNGVRLSWLAPTDTYLELAGEIMQGEGDPSGLGGHTLFSNVGGDVDDSHSWLAGLSHMAQDTGQSLDVAHFVWKWSPQGNWRQQNLVLQAEYFENSDNGRDTGWYAQTVYQPIPRWRFGARVDVLDLDIDDPRRYTVMMDWSNSEFSRLRLQYARSDNDLDTEDAWSLQYIHSIGAHGAHTF